MDCDDERLEELSSIHAIFPELVTDPANPYTVTLDVLVEPANPLKIYFQSSTQSRPHQPVDTVSVRESSGKRNQNQSAPASASLPFANALNIDVHSLSHLPPLRIRVTLPDGYPQHEPPQIAVDSSPLWLPRRTLDQLHEKCKELWEESGRYQVVYTLFDYLQQEAERAFGLADNPDHRFEASGDLKLVLLDYDFNRRRERFDNQTFDCGICLEPKKGKICHKLMLCNHVFCVQCLQDFYNNCITEGDVDSVKCLDPTCAKDRLRAVDPDMQYKVDISLPPNELLQIPIDRDKVQRYVHLKRKKRLEANKDTVYCPRKWCQGAAFKTKHAKRANLLQDDTPSSDEAQEENASARSNTSTKKKDKLEDIPMSERLRICEDCELAFCMVCKKVWHGERAFCNPRRQAELNAEEQASLDYLKKYSTPCPTCNAPAQKSMGCNHMICFKCNTHFCYLCSAYLMPDNPYAHFNNLGSNCYMRLWELEGGDGLNAGAGLAVNEPQAWEIEDLEDSSSEVDEDALDARDFANFAGRDMDWLEDTTDDEEPAPDQRRPDRPRIGIINFAGNAVERHIDLPANGPPPERQQQAPAAMGIPRRARRRVANRRQAAPRQANMPQNGPIEVVPPQDIINQDLAPVQVNAAPGQGNNADEALQRFLRLAMEDREDEWLSDDENVVIAPRNHAGNRQNNRRR